MKLPFLSLCGIILPLSIMLIAPAFAQNKKNHTFAEQWQDHTTKQYTNSPSNRPLYNKTPALKSAKKNMYNPLRHQGWHTHPDPYIEEGGVYTNKPHPATTQHGQSLHNYSSGSPNSHISPPTTVLNLNRKRVKQQAVQITDPLPGNVAPISLPPPKR